MPERIEFQRPKGQKIRVLNCSCSQDPSGRATQVGVFVQVDDNGEISIECTECGECYPLSEVVDKANEV